MKPARNGLYYTVSEAQEILGLRHSEFRQELEQNKIALHLLTEPREFLLFKALPDRSWQGVATCRYKGNLSIPNHLALKLLDSGKAYIGGTPVRLLEQQGLLSLDNKNPYEGMLPIAPLTNWNSLETRKTPDLSSLYATGKPGVSKHVVGHLYDIMEKMSGDKPIDFNDPTGNFAREEMDKPRLNFNYDAKCNSGQLRVLGDTINSYLEQEASAVSQLKITNEPSSTQSGKRENQLHSLITRILTDQPEVRAKAAWKIIEDEANTDTPIYDQEAILIHIDPQGIDWISRHGVKQTMTRASFDALVSKLRKNLKNTEKTN